MLQHPSLIRVASAAVICGAVFAVLAPTDRAEAASRPFRTDFCTHVPDFNVGPSCRQHDIDYGAGGNERQRLAADVRFLKDINRRGEPGLGILYFLGVRLFGWLFFF